MNAESTGPTEPAEPAQHWGDTESDLLFHPERYGPYSAAHHVAGHHWARHRLSFDRYVAGLRLRADDTLSAPERERTAVVEATAVLVEALAIEAAVCADVDVDFTFDLDIDWNVVREHSRSAHHDAKVRGCPASSPRVHILLRNEGWTFVTGRKILRDWVGIAGLANALGLGQVLEVDEVLRMLRR